MDRAPPPFNVAKPVIGMVHLKRLPVAALSDTLLEDVVAAALADAESLLEGGVDGLLVENFFSHPYGPGEPGGGVAAYMARITREITGLARGRPVGVNVLRNAGETAVYVACSSGASFIRVNALAEPLWAPEGLLLPAALRVAEAVSRTGCRPAIYGDVNVKHAVSTIPLSMAARETPVRGLADVLVVSGAATGSEAEPAHIAYVKMVSGRPVVVGSGVSLRNLRRFFWVADGFIVGTYFKKDGRIGSPVDRRRVEDFMGLVLRLRRRLGYG